jgi:hypothetical protein
VEGLQYSILAFAPLLLVMSLVYWRNLAKLAAEAVHPE